MLATYGSCDLAVNGIEALKAFDLAQQAGDPYQLICLDIMMPEMDGQQALKQLRSREKALGITAQNEVKVIMTTCVDSPRAVIEAYYQGGCTSYLVKPIVKSKLLALLRDLDLVPQRNRTADGTEIRS
jgi:two-component system chemotaxis response regulator CheY